jgi:transposase
MTKICIDDFALKKRQRYGTVLIDIETGRIIDMLESRESEDVSKWLSKYPNIQIVSRDGSQAYASAITASHPNAIQISDRFHILKNLTKKVNRKFHKLFKSRIVIPLTPKTAERKIMLGASNRANKIELVKKMHTEGRTIREISALTGIVDRTVVKYIKLPEKDIPVLKPDSREKEHINNARKLQDKIQLVKTLKAKGLSMRDIEKKTGLSRGTIRAYLSKSASPVNGQYGKHREGKLGPYREEVLKLKTEGYSYSQIYEKIQKGGYQGGQVAIRLFIAKERRFRNTVQAAYGNTPVELIDKRWVLSLIYQPLEKVTGITPEQFANVVKTYPLAGTLLKMVKDFKKILKSGKPRSIYY